MAEDDKLVGLPGVKQIDFSGLAKYQLEDNRCRVDTQVARFGAH